MKRTLLLAAVCLASALPVLAQATTAPALTYDVVSIKPNKSGPGMVRMMNNPDSFSAINLPVAMLLVFAYDLKDASQMVGLPGWANSDHFDIEARMDADTVAALKKLSPDEVNAQRRLMLQALLADRFKLKIHRETKELQLYTLVVAKGGPKLKEADPNDTYANGPKGPDGVSHAGMMFMLNGELKAQGIPISNLTRFISQQTHRQVLDGTGLKGKYDIDLRFTRDEAPADATDANPAPSLFTALQEQLGLKLDSSKGPAEVIVIDRIEQPTGN
jgi:uncharacterized protein (TIGR03435 family)